MTCLSDDRIQAVADHEASASEQEHVRGCERCASAVQEQRRKLAAVEARLGPPAPLPGGVAGRVEDALLAAAPVKGATRLRPGDASRPIGPRTAWGLGLAAAAAVVMLVFLPTLRGPGTVSASEVLAKSLRRLSQPVTRGVERLEYELTLEGMPKELMPDQASGTYRIEQLVDHDVPGRYRVSTFGPDGALISTVSEDPGAGRRTSLVHFEQQAYRFDFKVPSAPRLSLPEMERLHIEASVAVMQASGDQKLTVVHDGSGTTYVIQIPQVSAPGRTAIWDLQEARVSIDAADYRVKELIARGTLLKQPYGISYKLIRREVRPSADVSAEEFAVPEEPGALVLEGEGSANAMRDALVSALRELARTKAGR